MTHQTPSTTCPTCGGPKSKRAQQCRHCHLVEIAPLGWKATCEKYGVKVAVKHSQAYRLDNPSSLEQAVMEHLDKLGVSYEREVWFEDGVHVFLLDFRLNDGKVIEVNGEWVHAQSVDRDRRKYAALNSRGIEYLVLTETQIKTDLHSHLSAFMN